MKTRLAIKLRKNKAINRKRACKTNKEKVITNNKFHLLEGQTSKRGESKIVMLRTNSQNINYFVHDQYCQLSKFGKFHCDLD